MKEMVEGEGERDKYGEGTRKRSGREKKGFFGEYGEKGEGERVGEVGRFLPPHPSVDTYRSDPADRQLLVFQP